MPYCWKCGESLMFPTGCPACGATADARRPLPPDASDEARAMRTIYDHYGPRQLLTNTTMLSNALGDFLGEDARRLRNQVRTAISAGLGKLYQTQLTTPAPGFHDRAVALLTEEGLADAAVQRLVALFDDMIGLPAPEASTPVYAPAPLASVYASVPAYAPAPAAPVAPPAPRHCYLRADDALGSDQPRVFGSDYRREVVRTITFRGEVNARPTTAWDVSAAGDGTVWAWMLPTDETDYDDQPLFDLIIAGEGTIHLPENARELFYGYMAAQSIDFGGCVDTSAVVDMSRMFCWCNHLTRLDLSFFDTSNVLYMSAMFDNCLCLGALDISSFSTAKVRDMSEMFTGCASLLTLDLSVLDTSAVTTMYNMFSQCDYLRELNLTSFDTARVTDMRCMFRLCKNLRTVAVARRFTTAGSNTQSMFEGCALRSTADFTVR